MSTMLAIWSACLSAESLEWLCIMLMDFAADFAHLLGRTALSRSATMCFASPFYLASSLMTRLLLPECVSLLDLSRIILCTCTSLHEVRLGPQSRRFASLHSFESASHVNGRSPLDGFDPYDGQDIAEQGYSCIMCVYATVRVSYGGGLICAVQFMASSWGCQACGTCYMTC